MARSMFGSVYLWRCIHGQNVSFNIILWQVKRLNFCKGHNLVKLYASTVHSYKSITLYNFQCCMYFEKMCFINFPYRMRCRQSSFRNILLILVIKQNFDTLKKVCFLVSRFYTTLEIQDTNTRTGKRQIHDHFILNVKKKISSTHVQSFINKSNHETQNTIWFIFIST